MKSRLWLAPAVPLALASAFLVPHLATPRPARAVAAQATAQVAATAPPTAITPAGATIPAAAPAVANQYEFDLFSWMEFIALCWPADAATCGPDLKKSILQGTGPVVWETYLQPSDIFVPQGQQPAPWCGGGGPQMLAAAAGRDERIPLRARQLAASTGVHRFLHQSTKLTPQLQQKMPGMAQALGGPLTDLNGRWVRYEIRVNQDEYNYITKNNLWSAAGQKAFPGFPGSVGFPAGPSAYGSTGAMELKASWKVLGAGDDPGRFYTTRAIVYNDGNDPPTISPGPNPVTLGLVGFHIIHKTATQPNWVWSTFEQVDNLTRSFYNPNCPAATCPPNVQLAKQPYTELDPDGKPVNPPTQVTRLNPVGDPSADALNAAFRKLLGSSVWANYQLVSTQWSKGNVFPIPAYLANTTMETFAQEPSPPADFAAPFNAATYSAFATTADPVYPTNAINQSSSSCLKCHGATSSAAMDFTFILYGAQ